MLECMPTSEDKVTVTNTDTDISIFKILSVHVYSYIDESCKRETACYRKPYRDECKALVGCIAIGRRPETIKEGYHSTLNNPGEHFLASYFKDTLDTSSSLHLATF